MQSTTLFLVRHGEAGHNVSAVLSSATNGEGFGLTDRGREQIADAARLLAKEQIDFIVASPLRRTRETAGILGEALSMSYEMDDRLRETDFGSFVGRSAREFWQNYPSSIDRIKTDGTDGVESFEQVAGRVRDFFRDNTARFEGKRVVLVSHGDTLSVIRAVALGLDLKQAVAEWSPVLGSCTEISAQL